jgi:DNA-binding transcriptional MerR regulator
MFKIGDFSKLTRVPVRTLHYYDEIGLLKPNQVDRFTGYRYYSFEQLPRLNRILALKDLGFSLEQIAQLLDENLSPEQMRGMLRLRKAELQQQARQIGERLMRVEARLRQIEREDELPTQDVILKQVEPIHILSAREVVPEKAQMRERCTGLMDEVCDVLNQTHAKGTGLSLALYHDHSAQGIDVEMATVVENTAIPTTGRVRSYSLPAVQTMVSAVYTGSYDAFDAVSQVYVDLGKWIETNGYRIVGPCRELYLRPSINSDQPGVMEIQFPVEKA